MRLAGHPLWSSQIKRGEVHTNTPVADVKQLVQATSRLQVISESSICELEVAARGLIVSMLVCTTLARQVAEIQRVSFE